MTLRQKLLTAFWIFISCMLLWQCYNYNRSLEEQGAEHPQPAHYYFFNTNSMVAPGRPAPVHYNGAHVEQVGYSVKQNVPGPGTFTCYVTLKNLGDATATGIQAPVYPYRGTMMGDEDDGHVAPQQLDDHDPMAQIVQWIAFPDLAPGQSSTESAVFVTQGGLPPGPNPHPNITYETDKNGTPVPPSPSPSPETPTNSTTEPAPTTTPYVPPPTLPAHRPAE